MDNYFYRNRQTVGAALYGCPQANNPAVINPCGILIRFTSIVKSGKICFRKKGAYNFV